MTGPGTLSPPLTSPVARGGQLQTVRARLQNFLQARDRPVSDALQKSQNFLLTFSVPPHIVNAY